MIHVKRSGDESNQKVISTFLKRARRSNLVARKRKTEFRGENVSYLRRKTKALKKMKYLVKVGVVDQVGKR